jgi:hypothetical protein
VKGVVEKRNGVQICHRREGEAKPTIFISIVQGAAHINMKKKKEERNWIGYG